MVRRVRIFLDQIKLGLFKKINFTKMREVHTLELLLMRPEAH